MDFFFGLGFFGFFRQLSGELYSLFVPHFFSWWRFVIPIFITLFKFVVVHRVPPHFVAYCLPFLGAFSFLISQEHFTGSVLHNVLYWMTLRGFSFVIRRWLYLVTRNMRLTPFRQFFRWFVLSCDGGLYLFLVFFWGFAVVEATFDLTRLSLSGFTSLLLVWIPFSLLTSGVLVIAVVDLIHHFLFGTNFSLYGWYAQIGSVFRRVQRSIVGFLALVPFIPYALADFFAFGTYLMTQVALRLPMEIATLILGDSQQVDPDRPRYRFFWLRVALMLPSAFLITFADQLVFWGFLGWVTSGALFFFLTDLMWFGTLFVEWGPIFQSIAHLLGTLPQFLLPLAIKPGDVLTVNYKRSYLHVSRTVRNLLRQEPLYVVHFGAVRALRTFGSVENLTPAQVKQVFDRSNAVNVNFLAPIITLYSSLYVARWLYTSVVWWTTTLARLPISIMTFMLRACVPFLIPDMVFDYIIVLYSLLYNILFPQRNTPLVRGGASVLNVILDLIPSKETLLEFLAEVKRVLRMLNLTIYFGISFFNEELPDTGGPALKRTLPELNQLFVRTYVSLTRRAVIKFIEWADKLRVPEIIQATYKPPTLESIRSTYVFLQEIGFPVDQSFIDSLDRPEASAYLAEWGSWRNWLLGTSNFSLGFPKPELKFRDFLPEDFNPQFPGFEWTTSISGVAETIASTARYWTGKHKITLPRHEVDDLVDDLFEAVKAQYGNSHLTSFNQVFRNWKKNYNMGFGFGFKKFNRFKQATRQAVIDSMGGAGNFLKAWAKVFERGMELTGVAGVFTKQESLKAKKIMSRAVRTVVSSAFPHHVLTTIFGYKPNHNYKPWETPSKVGMPINGQNYNRMWESLATHQHVVAGDANLFDSQIPPPLVAVIKGLRKKGYSLHRDYHRICEIIDIAYDQLLEQPLGFKEFGDIATKGQGFTTGHSSTTPDNTLAMTACYLWMWRKTTGLRAREFFNYNTLVDFGDDHCIGFDKVFGWDPRNAWKILLNLGITVRDEAPGQDWLPFKGAPLPDGIDDWRDAELSFLSKKPLPLTPEILGELSSAGITVPLSFATCHDRKRLYGKIRNSMPLKKQNDPEKAYLALLGYLYLTPHHHDIYIELVKKALPMYNRACAARGGPKGLPQPPSYNQVLRQWYSAEPFPFSSEGSVVVDEDVAVIQVYHNPDTFGMFVRWVSDFPTLLSPRYKNLRWADWIQNRLSAQLSWPLRFIALSNLVMNDRGVARALAARTPYAFLRSELLVVEGEEPFGVLLVRHWIFMAYLRVFNYRKGFSPLDLIRLFDATWINALFMVTGKVTQAVVELDLHILDTIVIYLLSFLHVNLPLMPYPYYLPTPSDMIAQWITWLFGYFSPSGSVDLQSIRAWVRRASREALSVVLSAPTGTGKSTRMVNDIQNGIRRTVVVIVPRHLVAVGVGAFMQKLYPETGVFMCTEGYSPGPNPRIVYTTVQSFFKNASLQDPENLFILDEAHINEPHYQVMRRYFQVNHRRVIYMTATPGDYLPGIEMLEVPAVNSFTVHTAEENVRGWAQYIKLAAALANDRSTLEKILIFVPTISWMDALAASCRNKVCRLSSKHKEIDETASVYISTNVADAGLTIPDVGFVVTADADVTVIHVNEVPTSWYYTLPQTTLTQRKGRTGRTSSGAFLLVRLTDREVINDHIPYSHIDFMLSLTPAVQEALPYFPQAHQDQLDDFQKLALMWWDTPARRPSWESFQKWIAMTHRAVVAWNAQQGTSFTFADFARMAGSVNLKHRLQGEHFYSRWGFPSNPPLSTGETGDSGPDDPRRVTQINSDPSIPPLEEVLGATPQDTGAPPHYPWWAEIQRSLRELGTEPVFNDPDAITKMHEENMRLLESLPQPTLPGPPGSEEKARKQNSRDLPKRSGPPEKGETRKPPLFYEDERNDGWDVTTIPRSMPRHNVSGAGLLCGARAAIGIVYTATGIRLSDAVMATLISWEAPAHLRREEAIRHFELTQVVTTLTNRFNLRVRVILDGMPVADEVFGEAGRGPFYLLLDTAGVGHYNYFGHRYIAADVQDERIGETGYVHHPDHEDGVPQDLVPTNSWYVR